MKPKFTLRDLFWLVLVCAMGLGWGMEARREKLDRLNVNKLWAFDIASTILMDEVGAVMTVDENGVTVLRHNGTTDVYRFEGD